MSDKLVIRSIVSDERISAKFSDEKLPRYARDGELYVTDGILYVYVDLAGDGIGKWFPLTNKKEIFTFEQIVENTVWTIPYEYQTDNLQIIVYDHENKVHLIPYEINMTDGVITITFEEPARGEAYLIANKIFKWMGDGLIVGDKRFVVDKDPNDPSKYYLEIDTEFVEILQNGMTTFRSDVNIDGVLSANALSISGSQIIDGNVNVEGDLIVDGNISSVNITDLTSRIISLEILTTSDDINLDTIQEIVNYIKENRDSLTLAWDDLENNPTTLAGYGITDAYTKTEVDNAVSSATPNFSSLEGKPTTISGYGINDAYTKTEVESVVALSVPTFSTLSGKPTTLSGYGIVNAYTKTEVDSIIPTFSTLSGKPTTLSGYGITDVYTKVEVDSKILLSIPTFSTLSGKPTTLSGYGIIDAYTKTEVDNAVSSATPNFSSLEGKPSTLSGYGITDAVNKNNNVNLIGDVTGTATYDIDGNLEINATVIDDSHNHIFDNVDGLNEEFNNIGSFDDFSDGYSSIDGEMYTLTYLGALQDFIDGYSDPEEEVLTLSSLGTLQDFIDGVNGI